MLYTAHKEDKIITKDELFEKIAKKELSIQTLKTQNSDSLDFHDCAVWGIKAALEAAYEAGRQSLKSVK